MVGRHREELELATLVRERLAHILAENAPHRAPVQLPPTTAKVVNPPFEPTDDESEPVTVPVVDPDPDPGLRARRPFTRLHLGVVAALLIIGVIGAGWALLRAKPIALATPIPQSPPATLTSPTGPAATGPASPSPSQAGIAVHVLGAVARPGVITLAAGSRVADAIKAAGGLDPEANPAELNLARLLHDGEQIVIGTRTEPAGEVRDGGGSGQAAGPATEGAARISLNTATAEQLEALPGVGPITAQKILSWRSEHGRFSTVDELQEVDGIGPKTFAQLSPYLRV